MQDSPGPARWNATGFLVGLCFLAARVEAQGLESLWYVRGEASLQAFLAHADQISIVSPQVFVMDSTGVIRGELDPRLVATAHEKAVKLVPLVMNPGFDLASLHRVLNDPTARAQALASLAALCRSQHLDGIQFDFENIHVSDRDAFTAFTRAAVDSVHRAGCTLSAAVVPRLSDDSGSASYDRWIYDYWRGAYDYKALADTLDFLSYMTYAQHTGGTSPGPVSGYRWLVACLDFALSQGVPPQKLSLGIAGYSDWWYPSYDEKGGARLRGSDIPYTRGLELLARAGATAHWDELQQASFATWEDHGVFQHLWLEDATAFMAKREVALHRRLRGYSVWVLGHEDPAVWAALRDAAPDHR